MSVYARVPVNVSLGVTHVSWCQGVMSLCLRTYMLTVMCPWSPCSCVLCVPVCVFVNVCYWVSVGVAVFVSPFCLSLSSVHPSLRLLQCVFVTGVCGSVYVSDTLGLPISVSVCHRFCPSMCHHLPRCHHVTHCPGHRWACRAHWCQSWGPSQPTRHGPGRAPVCNACPR